MEKKSEFIILKNLGKLSNGLWTIFYKKLLYLCTIFIRKSIHSFIPFIQKQLLLSAIFLQVHCVLLGKQEDTNHMFCLQKVNNLTSDLEARLLSSHDTTAGFTSMLPPRQRERLYKSKSKNVPESIREVPRQRKF